jgi:hypothetical protein
VRVGFVAVAVLMVGCGSEVKSGKTDVAQRGLDQLVAAIMSQNPELIRARLSAEQISQVEQFAKVPGESIESILFKQYDHQRRGLIMNFGEEWLAHNSVEVAEAKELGDGFYAVSIMLNGEVFSKPVYFAEEKGEFKFAGLNNPTSVAAYASAVDINWNHWKFRSGTNICERVSMSCGLNFSLAFVAGRSPPNSTIFEINPANCRSYEYWYGAKHTQVDFLAFGPGPSNCQPGLPLDPGADETRDWRGAYPGNCMYNAIGLDAFTDSSAVFHCTPP